MTFTMKAQPPAFESVLSASVASFRPVAAIPANIRGIGATTWGALHALLAEVAQSGFISKSETRCAMTTLEWMSERFAPEISRKRLA